MTPLQESEGDVPEGQALDLGLQGRRESSVLPLVIKPGNLWTNRSTECQRGHIRRNIPIHLKKKLA